MTELVAFLRQQIAEDRRLAEAAAAGPWHTSDSDGGTKDVRSPTGPVTSSFEGPCCAEEDAEHIANWNPARVLAECTAKERILARYAVALETPPSEFSSYVRGQDDGYREACLDDLRCLALPYFDRPGYLEEWAP